MSAATQALPFYLKKYVAEQRYEKYTPEDHAAWRYIMRQNRDYFSRHAVSIYSEGLSKTGISLDRIPRISEMDECLSAFGWGAVPVIGFIPPAAFLEFQARGVLPIACDMRTLQHIAYTPAPDIVHEAAGHAPIVADPNYAAYLRRYAKMAQKAIQSSDDLRVYEAIRYLSDIKENPDTAPSEIALAEAKLKEVTRNVRYVSEGVKIARMAWWTVEYGLVETENGPKIYGAGLLSSVGESQACLSSHVKKIPLSVACVEQSYDITEPQPQLFVARSMDHLSHVLGELESTLAFRVGGEEALKSARLAETVTTTVLETGIAMSGVLTEYRAPNGAISFLKLSGPVQLTHNEQELTGHGRARHGTGFSSPVGRWKKFPDTPPGSISDAELASIGLVVGQKARLELANGFVVEGTFTGATRAEKILLLLGWRDCRVTLGSEVLFQPEWGEFDQVVGEKVVSVFGGPGDSHHYGEWDMGEASSTPSRKSPFTAKELALHDVFKTTREWRKKGPSVAEMDTLAKMLLEKYPDEWLPLLETYELLVQSPAAVPSLAAVKQGLETAAKKASPATRELITKGLAIASVKD